MTLDLRDRLQSVLGSTYIVGRELGGGGMSRLFLATERSLDRAVVVKVLPPEVASEVSAARFQREITVTAHLQHPHILPILAAGVDEGFLYYVMPYVDGESLSHRLAREKLLPVKDAFRLLREIADALAFAHDNGIVHRDVKPANILLTGKHAVLADFGIARAIVGSSSVDITESGHFVGTTRYMAPEQLTPESAVDGRADVFALGIVAYEALTGRLPFTGDTPNQYLAARLGARPPPIAELRSEVPKVLSDIVRRSLATMPDERVSAAEFRDALDERLSRSRRRRSPSRRGRILLTFGAVLLVVSGMLMLRRGVPPRVDDDLVAVAPFEVLRSDLALWREGLVDVLSSNLDGAGPLKTVPASVVVRNWQGRANVESAKALGTRSGARFVVIGHVIGAGADSARVTASVVDLVTGRKGEEVESRDATSHMDRVVDSLTVGILRDIGRVRPVSAVRRASIGSVSVPALRAFLEGEQFLRRTALDSARIAYERAMALDSNFALAHSHMSLTGGFGSDSTLRFHALRAGALNHGLAPRESLLISADSLRGATYAYNRDPEYWRHVQRLIATLSEATRRYAQDAEAWYRLADARFHFALGPRIGVSEADILRTFDRALMLDSAFEPAYIHTIELAFGSGDAQAARRYARAYFAHNPPDVSAVGTRLGVRLLDSSQRNLAEIRRTIDTASADLLFHAYSATRHSLDSAEVAVQLLRAMATVRHANDAALGDPAFARKRLALQLSYRGHLREAAALPETPRTTLYAQLALIGAVSPEVAGPVMAGWLSDEPRDPFFATPALVSAAAWWASRGDTTSLSRMRRRAEATLRRTVPGSDAEAARYEAPLADAYLALARHDTTEALRRFATLPDTLCSLCVSPRLTYGQLLAARGRYREAEEIFSQRISLLPSAVDVVLALEGARAAEKLGAKDRAARSYQRVALAWVHADPSVSSLVEEARAGLQRVQPESAPSHRP